jgi:flavin reductase (DIM6/NTAB) family NADH-FMN oxidoreductase RutF
MSGTRVELDVAPLEPMVTYPWLTATVIARPIAWVSSRSADRVDNLAPHSYFTVASAEPPVICFPQWGPRTACATSGRPGSSSSV